MDETYTTKTIILDSQPFREFDTKVILYSNDKGKLELVARGTKKLLSKIAGHIEPISLSQVMVVRGKKFNYIASSISQNCYFNIKNDLEKLEYAGRAISLFNKLIKENDQTDAESFFILLKEYLNIINNNKSTVINYELFYNIFILKLLVLLGYKPELYSCIICKKSLKLGKNYFNISQGGVVCAKCKKDNNTLTISENCIKVLRLVIQEDFKRLIKIKIKSQLARELCGIISSFLKYNFEIGGSYGDKR